MRTIAKRYADELRAIPGLESCSDRELAAIGRYTSEIRCPAGAELIDVDGAPNEGFLVRSGTVHVMIGDEVIAELGPGAIVGEIALIDRGRRTASVVAATDMVVLAFNAREFSGLKGIRPVMDLVARDLATRVRRANETVPAASADAPRSFLERQPASVTVQRSKNESVRGGGSGI